MSFILDALRKSDTERRRGRAPTLTETGLLRSGGAEVDQHGWQWWWLLPAAASLVLFWLGWGQWMPADSGARLTAEPDAMVQRAAETSVLTEPSPEELTADSTAPRKRSPVESYTAPVRLPAVADQEAAEPAAQVTGTAVGEQNVVQPVDQPETAQARPQSTPRQPVAEADSQAPGRNPIGFYELPANVRGDLGEIKITMQVWSADPDSRFALINGKRQYQGDQLGSGAEVTEILRQGVVFSYRNYYFVIGD